MPSPFSPGFVLLVASGYLLRILNRRPPFWERILHGLRYYGSPHEQDISNVLVAASSEAPPPGSVERLAGEALDVSLRVIPWSYFPLQTVPWNRMAGVDGLGTATVTALYACVGFILVHVWGCATGSSSAAVHADILLAVAAVALVWALAAHLARLGVSHAHVQLSALAGLAGFGVSFGLLAAAPAGWLHRLTVAPLRIAFFPSPPVAAAAAAASTDDAGVGAAATGPWWDWPRFVSEHEQLQELLLAEQQTRALPALSLLPASLCVGLLSALLLVPALTAVRTALLLRGAAAEAALAGGGAGSGPLAQLASTRPARAAASAGLLLAPLGLLAVWLTLPPVPPPHLSHLVLALPPPWGGYVSDVEAWLRSLGPDTWLSVRLAATAALAASFLAWGVRPLLQAHLLGARRRAVDMLLYASRQALSQARALRGQQAGASGGTSVRSGGGVASGAEAAAEAAGGAAEGGSGAGLSREAVELLRARCQGEGLEALLSAPAVALHLLAAPLVVLGLSAAAARLQDIGVRGRAGVAAAAAAAAEAGAGAVVAVPCSSSASLLGGVCAVVRSAAASVARLRGGGGSSSAQTAAAAAAAAADDEGGGILGLQAGEGLRALLASIRDAFFGLPAGAGGGGGGGVDWAAVALSHVLWVLVCTAGLLLAWHALALLFWQHLAAPLLLPAAPKPRPGPTVAPSAGGPKASAQAAAAAPTPAAPTVSAGKKQAAAAAAASKKQ